MTTQFQIGRTYKTRSICDHECIYSFTIISRTAKTITTKVNGKIVKRGLSVCKYDDAESLKPFGNYSMCAVIRANKQAA